MVYEDLPIFWVHPEMGIIDPMQASEEEFIEAEPCTGVGFTYNERLSKQVGGWYNYQIKMARIDIAAERVYADISLVEACHCPRVDCPQVIVEGVACDTYRGSLVIRGQVADMDFVALDFRGRGKPFDLALGRQFLRFCTLTYDGPKRDLRAIYHGISAAG